MAKQMSAATLACFLLLLIASNAILTGFRSSVSMEWCELNGECVEGVCNCKKGFIGDNCSQEGICLSGCSGRGQCGTDGNCLCEDGWAGHACEQHACSPACVNGVCSNGNCFCEHGYYGADCSISLCHAIACGDNGKCVGGLCFCDAGYRGSSCEIKEKSSFKARSDRITSRTAEDTVCPSGCNGYGVCVAGECYCDQDHSGVDCSAVVCSGRVATECYGRGSCVSGACECESGYEGSQCQYLASAGDGIVSPSPISAATISAPTAPATRDTAPGMAAVTVSINCPSLSVLDFSSKLRNDLEANFQHVLDSLAPGDAVAPAATVVSVSAETSTVLLHSVTVVIQAEIPASIFETVSFNLQKELTKPGKRCDLLEKPILSNQILPEFPDCHCSGNGACDSTETCKCHDGWTGRFCDVPRCHGDCSNHGECSEGKCTCEAGWTEGDCSIPTCIDDCSGNGKCIEDHLPTAHCECDAGYTGNACEQVLQCGAKFTKSMVDMRCNRQGTCQDDKCFCRSGYSGDDCETADCLPFNCNHNGKCRDGECFCKDGWTGVHCHIKDCLSDCNDRGKCDGNVCVCKEGWVGKECEIPSIKCPNQCNEHSEQGVCIDDKCECATGFYGVDCSKVMCEDDCNGRGACEFFAPDGHLGGFCRCEDGFYGAACEEAGCKHGDKSTKQCSGRGECLEGGGKEFLCSCEEGWVGEACDVEVCEEECLHGTCEDGKCMCEDGFGHSPDKDDCGFEFCPNACHAEEEQGYCEDKVSCVCADGWTGIDCSEPNFAALDVVLDEDAAEASQSCPSNCYDRGQCTKSGCKCEKGFSGISCGCENDCSGNGECSDELGRCDCNDGWVGADCALEACGADTTCSEHGTCFDGVCECEMEWTGTYCDEPLYVDVKEVCAGKSNAFCETLCSGGDDRTLKDCDNRCHDLCFVDCVVNEGEFKQTCFQWPK